MLDLTRAGTPEQYRELAEYLATINLSSTDKWDYELKTLPRPKGRATRVIVTQYDMQRPTNIRTVLVDDTTTPDSTQTSCRRRHWRPGYERVTAVR